VLHSRAAKSQPARGERELRKEMSNLEKSIARLDDQKRQLNARYLAATDPQESLRLHTELEDVTRQLGAAEDQWAALQEELGGW
jgi:ATP-binding cassette subfamily F protein 3